MRYTCSWCGRGYCRALHLAHGAKGFCHAAAPAQMDENVQAVVAMLVRCAYGRPADLANPIPSRAACVEVALRECAYNPLSPPCGAHPRDETIYVAFQQHIRVQARGAPSFLCMRACFPGAMCVLASACVPCS